MLKFSCLAIVMLFFVSCSSIQNATTSSVADSWKGASKEEIIQQLGKPDFEGKDSLGYPVISYQSNHTKGIHLVKSNPTVWVKPNHFSNKAQKPSIRFQLNVLNRVTSWTSNYEEVLIKQKSRDKTIALLFVFAGAISIFLISIGAPGGTK